MSARGDFVGEQYDLGVSMVFSKGLKRLAGWRPGFFLVLAAAAAAQAELTQDQVSNQVQNPDYKISFEKRKIQVGLHALTVEVADTDLKRARGLMFRKKFVECDGMLFIFDRPERLSFWMKNTWMPLSIGYFDKNGRLLNVQEMEPSKSEMQTALPSYPSAGVAKYALEMPQGWFDKKKVSKGARLKLK